MAKVAGNLGPAQRFETGAKEQKHSTDGSRYGSQPSVGSGVCFGQERSLGDGISQFFFLAPAGLSPRVPLHPTDAVCWEGERIGMGPVFRLEITYDFRPPGPTYTRTSDAGSRQGTGAPPGSGPAAWRGVDGQTQVTKTPKRPFFSELSPSLPLLRTRQPTLGLVPSPVYRTSDNSASLRNRCMSCHFRDQCYGG